MPRSSTFGHRQPPLYQSPCGTCLQIAVNLARKPGARAEIVRYAAQGRDELLPIELREIYRFAQKQANRIDDDELRERLRARCGNEALIELALAIASACMFPAFKRTLGFAESCSMVRVVA